MAAKGYKQKLQEAAEARAASSSEQPPAIESNLATKLVHMWAQGALSAAQLQQLAHAATMDGARLPELVQLSSIGTWGAHPGNCNRDLKRMYLGSVKVSPPHVLPVPCIDPKGRTLCTAESCHMILPHQMFASLANYGDSFSDLLGVPFAHEFWESIRTDDPKMVNHPLLGVPGFREKTIPVWLHGDGVGYGDRDSLLCFSWGSLLTTSNTLDSSFYIASWPKSWTLKKKPGEEGGTWENIYKTMIWSFQAMLEGKHPAADVDGQAWPINSQEAALAGKDLVPGNWRCVAWGVLGDQEFFCNTLGMPHWNKPSFCWHCSANKTEGQHWKDFADERGWVYRTPQEEQDNPISPHWFFKGLPGVTSFSLCLDVLHVIDLGLNNHLAGSTLKHLVYHQLRGGRTSAADALAVVWGRCLELYEDFQVATRFAHLHLGMFISDTKSPHANFPELGGKASEKRHFIAVLAQVAQEFSEPGDESHYHRAEACKLLASFYELLDSQPMFMSDEAAAQTVDIMKGCLRHYSWLTQWAEAKGLKLHHQVSKFHFAVHLAQQATYMNPRLLWTYRAESWLGKMSAIAHSTSFGTRGTRLTIGLCDKFRVMLHFRLTRPVFED